MTLEDIKGAMSDQQFMKIRDRIIDRAIAGMPEQDLLAIQEIVALQHAKVTKQLGDLVRRSNPRTNPIVRSEVFSRLPSPEQIESRANVVTGGQQWGDNRSVIPGGQS